MERQMDFIKVKAPYRKLKTAETMQQTIYIYGVTGYGKTTLVLKYLSRTRFTYLVCKNGYLTNGKDKGTTENPMEPEQLTKNPIVVVDNLQFLKKSEEQKKVLDLIMNPDIWVILIARCSIPSWLQPTYLKEGMLVVPENELYWNKENIKQYFLKYHMELTEEDVEQLYVDTKGNPLAVRVYLTMSEEAGGYRKEFFTKAWHAVEVYVEQHVMEEWDRDMLELLMQVSFVEKFTLSMAEMISGNKDVYRILEEAKEIGNFLDESADGIYRIRTLLRTALQKRAHREYGSSRCREIYYNTGLFYEMQDDMVSALKMYEKSENPSRIKEILIRNARKNPGNGHYFLLRKYYLALSEEEIEKDALLMTGMSMLYSLLLQPDKSEYWYQKLAAYEKKQTGGVKREARSRLAYLDIALGQRGSHGVLDIIKTVPAMLFDRGISLPEFSVTSNLPSIMNGGKDFCEWSGRDRELGAAFGKLIELVLGAYGKGLVNIAIAESQYEKGGDTYEILSLLSKGILESQAGGKIEIEFAAIGIQVRLNMLHGNAEAAWSILESFEKKVLEEHEEELQQNLDALKCRLALNTGNDKVIEKWMQQAPNEETEFYILNRYQYLTKVRCYLQKGDSLRALALLEKLQYYASLYERSYIAAEVKILMAIVRYRLEEASWRELFLEGVHMAEKFHFLRIISEEGAAVKELLEDKSIRKSLEKCEYIDRLYMETRQMAGEFPQYLLSKNPKIPEFSENALKILQLQAKGLTSKEIAGNLGVKEETVRYHSRQNYKKLGVAGKADAVLAARNLKLL